MVLHRSSHGRAGCPASRSDPPTADFAYRLALVAAEKHYLYDGVSGQPTLWIQLTASAVQKQQLENFQEISIR